MSGINLSLPVDIPWKLIATTPSMMDLTIGSGAFPPKWRSSLAIFSFEPELPPEDESQRRVTYFKVVATITGYQTNKVRRRFVDFGPIGPFIVNGLEEGLNRYYACYGALLQVTVVPEQVDSRSDPANYPIITDVEPKRRDLYELVTDTGEVLSGSSNRAAVNKGFTSSYDTESSWGLSATGKGGGKSASGEITGSLAGKSSFGTKDQTITQVDYAREKRESESHVTQLTQMYNLLQAYHLGTNRAVFLVLPRPHVVEEVEKRTFINGPREIEGIQEFFFITSRPKEVEHLCVEATLETGHLDLSPADAETQTTDEKIFGFEFLAPRKISHGGGFGDDSTSRTAVLTKAFTPPTGWEIDVSKGSGGYVVLWTDGSAAYTVQSSANAVIASGTVVTTYVDVSWSTDNYYSYQDVRGELQIFLKKKASVTEGEVRSTFFVTGRTVIGCSDPNAQTPQPTNPEWVTFEAPIVVDPMLSSRAIKTSVRMQLANDLSKRVGTVMLESLHARPRYKDGVVDFHQSQYVLERLASAAHRGAPPGTVPPLTRPLADAHLDSALMDRLSGLLGPKAFVADLVRTPTAQIAQGADYDITMEEALTAKWKALGFGPKELPETKHVPEGKRR
jgi:hypothetical protein